MSKVSACDGRPAVFQHVQPPGVVGLQHAHVVGHDVQDLPHAVAAQGLAQAGMRGLVAHLRVQLAVVDDVVAVRAARDARAGRASCTGG
jgi:hypothetical protein